MSLSLAMATKGLGSTNKLSNSVSVLGLYFISQLGAPVVDFGILDTSLLGEDKINLQSPGAAILYSRSEVNLTARTPAIINKVNTEINKTPETALVSKDSPSLLPEDIEKIFITKKRADLRNRMIQISTINSRRI